MMEEINVDATRLREYSYCDICNEGFDARVWHCVVCAHHWPMHRTECWNCHKHKRSNACRAVTEKQFKRYLNELKMRARAGDN